MVEFVSPHVILRLWNIFHLKRRLALFTITINRRKNKNWASAEKLYERSVTRSKFPKWQLVSVADFAFALL